MTPAERALLLAVASELRGGRYYGLEHYLDKYIRAVQAEAAFAADDEAELAEVAEKARACEPDDDVPRVYEEAKAAMRAAAYDPEPLTEGRSCETCVCWPDMPRAVPCHLCVEFSMWKKPKPTEADVCPTCEGDPVSVDAVGVWVCPDCGGTGKEKK